MAPVELYVLELRERRGELGDMVVASIPVDDCSQAKASHCIVRELRWLAVIVARYSDAIHTQGMDDGQLGQGSEESVEVHNHPRQTRALVAQMEISAILLLLQDDLLDPSTHFW